jgi:hypothetical protein
MASTRPTGPSRAARGALLLALSACTGHEPPPAAKPVEAKAAPPATPDVDAEPDTSPELPPDGPSRMPGCARMDCKTRQIVDHGCIVEDGKTWCASCVEACPGDLEPAAP